MAHGRSLISLLCATIALLGLPAAALAQSPPTNDTPATPGGWHTAPYAVNLAGTDPDGGAVTMNWRLDGGAINTVTNGGQIIISDSGDWDFETQAMDVDGMDSGWRLENLRIDTIAPTDGTDSGGLGWRNATVNVAVFAADVTSGIDHVEWELDGGPTQTGANNASVQITGDGVHTLRTRAEDVAGNVSVWRDHTIRIDTVTPTDTTSPNGGWNTAPALVNITGTDALSGVDRVQYRVNGGATVETGTPASVSVSTEGVNTVQTRVRDAAGNWTGWKDSTVRVDTTAPTNQTDVSDGVWTTANYAVLVKAVDGVSGLAEVEYRVDGGPWVQGPSGITAQVSGTGDHTLETRARDVAGNTSLARLDNVRIDRVAPTNTTAAAPGGTVGNPYTVPVTGTDDHSGIAHVEWRVDGGTIQTGPSGTTATVSGNGVHTLETRVVDNVGYDSGWRSSQITIDAVSGDTTDPVDTTTAASSGWYTGPVNVTVGATDAGSGVAKLRWRIDGQPLQEDPGPTRQIQITGEGVHRLETMAVDIAGNDTAWRSQFFKIDQSVPVDTVAIPTGWSDSTEFTLTATDAFSGIAEIEYTINGGAVQHGTPNQVVDVNVDGTYTIVTRAIDQAGHAALQRTQTLKVDTVLPVNTSAAAPAGPWLDEPLELVLSGTDAGSGLAKMQWRVDGGAIQDGSPAVVDTDGAHTLETRAVDLAGNASAWRSESVSIDAAAPENTTPAAPAGWRRTPYSVEITGDDGDGSGIDTIERTVDGGAVSVDPQVTITGDGVHVLRSRIVDNVGHASAWREDAIRIDTVVPTAALDCGAGGWNRAAVACTPAADGGPSGLSTLTLSGNGVTSGVAVPVEGDGVHALTLRAVDGAGNVKTADATVHIDATAPAAILSCTAADSQYSCVVDGSDGLSGLAALSWSVDGGAWTGIAPGGSFTVAKGSVRVRAVDVAGNEFVSGAAALAAQAKPGVTVKIASAPVYLAGKKTADNLVGAVNAARSSNGTVSLDLRPLAVGRGSYRVELKLESGRQHREVTRRYTVGRTGTLPRLSASLAKATERTTVTLTVLKQVGGKWKVHAGTRLVLAK